MAGYSNENPVGEGVSVPFADTAGRKTNALIDTMGLGISQRMFDCFDSLFRNPKRSLCLFAQEIKLWLDLDVDFGVMEAQRRGNIGE